MVKLSLKELDEAFSNPTEYREKLAKRRAEPPFYPPSYFLQLTYAIFKFHDEDNDPVEGEIYLNEKLSNPKLTNESRKKAIREQYVWYVKDFMSKGIWHSDVRYNISFKPNEYLSLDLTLSGQIGRLDLNPNGYSVWMFRSKDPKDWIKEIRMPLIQDGLSKILNVSLNEVTIGIYSFEEKYIEEHNFSIKDVQISKMKLAELLDKLGYV